MTETDDNISEFLAAWDYPILHGEEEAHVLRLATRHLCSAFARPIDDVMIYQTPEEAYTARIRAKEKYPQRGDHHEVMQRATYKAVSRGPCIILPFDLTKRKEGWGYVVMDQIRNVEKDPTRNPAPYDSLLYLVSADLLAMLFKMKAMGAGFAEFDGLIRLVGQASYVGLHNRVAYVGRAPSIIKVNSSGRLHCPDGPAVEYPGGGKSYYFLDGIQIDERAVMKPETVKVDDILYHSNIEVRRILIDRIGIDVFLRKANSREVAADDYGRLYHITNQREASEEPTIAFVRLLNSSPDPGTTDEYREYLLRVPPTVTTPHEAVAWSFDKTPATYHLLVQT